MRDSESIALKLPCSATRAAAVLDMVVDSVSMRSCECGSLEIRLRELNYILVETRVYV